MTPGAKPDHAVPIAQEIAIEPLTAAATAALLAAVRAHGPGRALDRLVEGQLGAVLAAAEAHAGRGVDAGDLFQEGTIATIVAVSEHAARGGDAGALDAHVARVIAAHLEHTVEVAAIDRAGEEAFVRDAQTYELAEVDLRHRLGRSPAVAEMAASLRWPEERVAMVAEMLDRARLLHDGDLVDYLDDADPEDAG